ncbi:MAG: HAD family phosphatase [Ignavibacteriaceae bacterium]
MTGRKYSVIVFDLGMVLISFDYNIALEKLERIEKGFGVNYLNHYKANYETHRQFERGDISEDEFLRKTMVVFNGRLDIGTFKKIYSEIFTINEDVAALLPWLKKKYKLIVLSNTNSIHKEYGWKDYDFLKYFDEMVLSHEAKAVKPEEKIYRAVEKVSRKLPEEHIFIDDIKDYTEAAIKLGWDGIQFTGYEKLVNELRNRQIL